MKLFSVAVVLTALGLGLLPGGRSAAQKADVPALKRTDFEDGTGSIGLPRGWKLEGAYRGSAQCTSPDGSTVIVGFPWTILRPDSSVAALPAAAQSPLAASGDLLGAVRQVVEKQAKARLKSLRSQPAPSALPGVPALYLMYEFVQGGKTYAALGYFTTLDYGPGNPSWQLYSSAVIAPRDRFLKQLPTLLAIWRSWRSSGNAPSRGSESAKIDALLKDRWQSLERMQEAFRKQL